LALIITATIFADAALGTSLLKPVFFCYAMAGLYGFSVLFEMVHEIRSSRG